MNYLFVFDDGDNNLVNEQGEPIIDDLDMDDCLPLETLTDLTRYREIARSLLAWKSMWKDISPIKKARKRCLRKRTSLIV
jgi:hypothetical protein